MQTLENQKNMISVGIIGGSGYTGKYLLKFCSAHPFIHSVTLYGKKTAGKSIYSIFPELSELMPDMIVTDASSLSYQHDVYFTALPHGEALLFVPQLIEAGKTVIDLGGDYRLENKTEYEKWYHQAHNSADLLQKKTYGIADYLHRVAYTESLIANPGCYPTATLLGLLPLAEYFSDRIISISTAAYSGSSGAGKSPKAELLLSEMHGNVRAYSVNTHRHQPEIEQNLRAYQYKSDYSFTTHLLPVAVGIYATSTVFTKEPVPQETLDFLYKKQYSDSPFVRVRESAPDLNWVVGTNFCDINISANGRTIVITSAIDNLIKGASGQAIQNLNKYFGWDETLGIIPKGIHCAKIPA